MYNKYIFINNNRKKRQKESEINGEINDTQISFEMLSKIQNENNKEKSNQYNKNAIGKNLTKFIDDYVLVDIETTGFSPINDEIIEIGAIKVENNKIVKQYDELIKIDKILPQKITELTGITDNMLKNGKLPNIVLEEFIKFVGNNIIVGDSWVEPFEKSGLADPMITEMLKIGMQTDLPTMMDKLVEYMDMDIDQIIDRIIKILPQVLYSIIGVLIILITLVVLVPCIQVYMGTFLFSAAGF